MNIKLIAGAGAAVVIAAGAYILTTPEDTTTDAGAPTPAGVSDAVAPTTPSAEDIAKAKEEAEKAKAEAKAKAEESLAKARELFDGGQAEAGQLKIAYNLALEAADAGNLPEAQFFVGNMYYNGYGIERDYKQAYKWLTLSNIYKVPGSRKMLNWTYRKLSKEERNEVKALVKEYLDSHNG